MSGVLPRGLAGMTQLELLVVEDIHPGLSGTIPEAVACWRRLRVLHASYNRLSGSTLARIGGAYAP